MVVYNYSGKEINAKVVYYGPALSGKTTNLEWIYSKIPTEYSGKMVSLRTQADRTIFFDFLPLELGLIDGFKTRFMLYTVPGQVYYNATRKMVLKGVDGVVFVADSERGRMDDNFESFENLKENLAELGIDPSTLPMVLQWNKRDLPDIESVAELERRINSFRAPSFEASAPTGQGVYETLHRIAQMVYQKLTMGDQAAAGIKLRSNDPADSLFGATIASKLQEIDHPVYHEKLALEDLVEEAPADDRPVMASILGRNAAAQAAPARSSSQPQAPVARANADDHALDDVVDQLLSQFGDEKTAPAMASAHGAGGSDRGRAVPAGKGPHAAPISFDEPDAPLIEHDVDLFEQTLASREVAAHPKPQEDDLQLITDPRKLASNAGPSGGGPNSSGISRPLGLSSVVPREGIVLEIPVTIDLERLAEGESIQIILQLRG